MRHIATLEFVAMLLLAAWPARGQEPVLILSGDGVTIVVTEMKDETSFAGEVRIGGAAYPFKGQLEADDDEVVVGTYIKDGRAVPFKSVEQDEQNFLFTTAGRTYRLRTVEAIPAGPAPAREGNDPPDRSAPARGDAAPKGRAAAEQAPADRPVAPPLPQDQIRLKRARFYDVNMGNVLAATMVIPHDWKTEGNFEWSPADDPFPQRRIKIITPDGGKLQLPFTMRFSYTEVNPVPGFPPVPPQGTPPPQHLGDWIVSAVAQAGKVSNVRLIDDRQDVETEREAAQLQRGGMAISPDIRRFFRIVTISYDENGTAMQEQIRATLALIPPIVNQNIRSQVWLVSVSDSVAAPREKFDPIKAQLLAYYGTYREEPRWFAQYIAVRQQLLQQRQRNFDQWMQNARQNYQQMSDAQAASFKKQMVAGDESQRKTIQGIYEVSDFRDRDGSSVELPIHYKHVYSDGQGNYLLSNSTLAQPGSAFEEIQPAR